MGKVTKYFICDSRLLRMIAALAALLLLTTIPAFSQGCALCYTQAASSGARMISALRIGILVLIVPPTLGSIGMLFVVHRKRNQVRRDPFFDEPDSDWDQDRRALDWRENDWRQNDGRRNGWRQDE
jgi:hypothetical protein